MDKGIRKVMSIRFITSLDICGICDATTCCARAELLLTPSSCVAKCKVAENLFSRVTS